MILLLLHILVALLFASFSNNLISYFSGESKFDFFHSKCKSCRKRLGSLELIPIISYALLAGKCKGCSFKISLRYLLVEIILPLAAIMTFGKYGYNIDSYITFLSYSVLLVIAFVDWKTFKIPNVLLSILLVFSIINYPHTTILAPIVLFAIIGLLLLINKIYFTHKGYEVIGMGDIKLLAILILLFDLPGSVIGLWLASIIGIIISGFLSLIKYPLKNKRIPFGTCIGIGYFFSSYFNNELILLYYDIAERIYV